VGPTVGSYTTSANAFGAALGNYDVTYINGTYTITPATLTVTTDNKVRSHTAPNPLFTGTITGVVPGDGITVTYSTTATTVPGSYTITPALVDPNGKLGNYGVTLSPGTLTLTNAAPVANNDTHTAQWNTPLTVAAAGVLSNDTDADNDPLSAITLTNPAHGTVTLNGNGSFTYMPAANYMGTDSFTYKANDGYLDSNVATVTFTITSTCSIRGDDDDADDDDEGDGRWNHRDGDGDDHDRGRNGHRDGDGCEHDRASHAPRYRCARGTPIARDDRYATKQQVTLNVAPKGVLANDGRYAASSLLITAPVNGTVTLNLDGSFSYTPAVGFFGIDSFVYVARNAAGVAGPVATARIVVEKNVAPRAENDDYKAKKNTQLTIAAAGVLANDSDPNGDALTAVLVSGPAHGTLTLSANGAFVYMPALNYVGLDTFVYNAKDPLGLTGTATVTIRIKAANSRDDEDDRRGSKRHDGNN
jgi:hypothetical protein